MQAGKGTTDQGWTLISLGEVNASGRSGATLSIAGLNLTINQAGKSSRSTATVHRLWSADVNPHLLTHPPYCSLAVRFAACSLS